MLKATLDLKQILRALLIKLKLFGKVLLF